jgi:hypothetical protein
MSSTFYLFFVKILLSSIKIHTMAYPERKPIYDAYKEIVKQIIDTKLYKEYAEAEVKALDQALLESFRSIRLQLMMSKDWKSSSH